MKPSRGISILEGLIVSGFIALIVGVIASLFAFQRRTSVDLSKRNRLAGVLNENIAEINSKQADSLPAIGMCLVRYYDLYGTFIREIPSVPATSAECKTVISTEQGIKIAIRSQAVTSDISFEPAEFLKLPRYNPRVKQVQVAGGINLGGAKQFELSLTLFRRNL